MVKVFVSELEKIIPAQELIFEPTPGFGRYKPFLEHAIAHPAKMNTTLLNFLIKNFTKPGETVLDPMCGSGSTGVVAALHGRNAIQIDIEEKFVKWAEEAKRKVESSPALTPKGRIINICGDARRLSQLLSEADVAITSPPFGDSYVGGGDPERRRERLIKAGHDPKDFLGGKARNAVLKHYYQKRDVERGYQPYKGFRESYSEKTENIGNLPHGEISAIITSPPYADGKKGEVKPEEVEKYARRWEENVEKRGWNSWGKSFHTPGRLRGIQALRDGYSESKENIGNLPFVDTVITSPPYEASVSDNKESPLAGGDEKKYGRWAKGTARKHSYTQHGEPCKVDTVITSPPYEGSLEGTTRHTRGGIASRDPALAQTGSYATVLSDATKQGVPVGYSPNKDNIGNLKSSDDEYEALARGLMKNGKPTYLSEMLKVCREMFHVLKPGGLAIIVVKPFQRRGKIVDLPYHTFLLMRKCGFALERLYKLRLKQFSFWRVLAYKKNPNIPQIRHEYVLIMRKT